MILSFIDLSPLHIFFFFSGEIIFLLGGINKTKNKTICGFICGCLKSKYVSSCAPYWIHCYLHHIVAFLNYMRRSVGIPTFHVYSKTILLTILWVIVKGCPSLGGCGDPAQSQMDPFPLLKLHIWRALVRVCNAIIKGGGGCPFSVTVSHLKCRRCRESFCGPWMCRWRSGGSWSGKAEAWCSEETETLTCFRFTTHNFL